MKLERWEGQWAPQEIFHEAAAVAEAAQATVLESHLVRNIQKGIRLGWNNDVRDAIATHFFQFDDVH